jgi:hypothetical protein
MNVLCAQLTVFLSPPNCGKPKTFAAQIKHLLQLLYYWQLIYLGHSNSIRT